MDEATGPAVFNVATAFALNEADTPWADSATPWMLEEAAKETRRRKRPVSFVVSFTSRIEHQRIRNLHDQADKFFHN